MISGRTRLGEQDLRDKGTEAQRHKVFLQDLGFMILGPEVQRARVCFSSTEDRDPRAKVTEAQRHKVKKRLPRIRKPVIPLRPFIIRRPRGLSGEALATCPAKLKAKTEA